MATKLQVPNGTGVVEVSDEAAETYLAAGWTRAGGNSKSEKSDTSEKKSSK